MEGGNIEMKSTGLLCDNPVCDWKDESIGLENFREWLNAPCPKCGSNLLTEEDLTNVEAMIFTTNFINSLSQDKLEELAADIKESGLENPLDNVKGADYLKTEDTVMVRVNTHKEIKITEIAPLAKKKDNP
jgi:hypothetical protein